ncbi:MAG: amidase family protein, partial [Marinomonas sp.]
MTQPNQTDFPWLNRDLKTQWEAVLDTAQLKGKSVFTELFGYREPAKGPLNGAIVSIKDLFDVTGYKTQAGSVFLDSKPAENDAAAVSLLRNAGASLIGHTNMTELAYSGLGLNPHYGTPDNPIIAGRIPGGSTSGGAVSVALGVADAALGTDTGGSLRIPAAFCGVTGFKPSEQTVSREGCLPLSGSLDSVGPIANTVEECELFWKILSGASEADVLKQESQTDLSLLTLVVPTNFGMNELDTLVEQGFSEVLSRLEESGVKVEHRFVDALEAYKSIPVWQFSAFECDAYYGEHYDLSTVNMDPRVASRVARAQTMTMADFAQTKAAREEFIQGVANQEANTVFL